ncbi:MAG: SoxR reducing system RseC family protein [Alistipes sp.]|nr:SoxR reducing system RseC family protein [Alistipes sp.]
MAKEIQHIGTVAEVSAQQVVVRITSRSACGSCAARSACGLAEAQEKLIEVNTADAARYAVGDEVTVGVKPYIGAKAVGLAYVGALVVLILALVLSVGVFGVSEGVGVLITLAAVALYYGVLWLVKDKIEHTIQFTINKN